MFYKQMFGQVVYEEYLNGAAEMSELYREESARWEVERAVRSAALKKGALFIKSKLVWFATKCLSKCHAH